MFIARSFNCFVIVNYIADMLEHLYARCKLILPFSKLFTSYLLGICIHSHLAACLTIHYLRKFSMNFIKIFWECYQWINCRSDTILEWIQEILSSIAIYCYISTPLIISNDISIKISLRVGLR